MVSQNKGGFRETHYAQTPMPDTWAHMYMRVTTYTYTQNVETDRSIAGLMMVPDWLLQAAQVVVSTVHDHIHSYINMFVPR